MPTSSNGTASDDASRPQTQTVLLEVLSEVLIETYRTSAQVKLLLRSLSDDMSAEVDEDRSTILQALKAISEGDIKAKVQQFAQRLEARGIALDDEDLAPLSEALSSYLEQNSTSRDS